MSLLRLAFFTLPPHFFLEVFCHNAFYFLIFVQYFSYNVFPNKLLECIRWSQLWECQFKVLFFQHLFFFCRNFIYGRALLQSYDILQYMRKSITFLTSRKFLTLTGICNKVGKPLICQLILMKMMGTYEASRIFNNLSERDLTKIRIHSKVPNDIELLCSISFQIGDRPSHATQQTFTKYGAQGSLSSLL